MLDSSRAQLPQAMPKLCGCVLLRCIYIYIYCTWQRLKNIGLVTGPRGLFATRLVTDSGGLRQILPATSLLKTTVLYRPATRVCNTGPATKVCNRVGRGGPRQTHVSSHSHVYIYIYTYLFIYLFIYLFMY